MRRYRQVLEYLEGNYDFEQLRERGIAATRQLAKRQLTWLRSWDQALVYAQNAKTFPDIMAKIREIIDNKIL